MLSMLRFGGWMIGRMALAGKTGMGGGGQDYRARDPRTWTTHRQWPRIRQMSERAVDAKEFSGLPCLLQGDIPTNAFPIFLQFQFRNQNATVNGRGIKGNPNILSFSLLLLLLLLLSLHCHFRGHFWNEEREMHRLWAHLKLEPHIFIFTIKSAQWCWPGDSHQQN